MTRKKQFSDSQKKAEGIRLKKIWLEKIKPNGVTQLEFCDAIGLNQGMLQQMFEGKVGIPLDTLLNLSLAIGFDPREIRPDIESVLNKILLAMKGLDNKNIRKELSSLPTPARTEIQALLDNCKKLTD